MFSVADLDLQTIVLLPIDIISPMLEGVETVFSKIAIEGNLQIDFWLIRFSRKHDILPIVQ